MDVKYPLPKYAVLLSIILISTFVNMHLDILDMRSLVTKSLILILFIGTSFFLLVKPYFNHQMWRDFLENFRK